MRGLSAWPARRSGERAGGVPSERRNVGVVFQSYALWPHMTVEGNVSYPLRVLKKTAMERKRRVARALAAVRLEEMAHRKPHELSGGQQQRVALARCLTQEPRIVLMDEPLANLDMHLRENMLEEFRGVSTRPPGPPSSTSPMTRPRPCP